MRLFAAMSRIRNRPTRRRAGFTLVELLVVIGIIALLLGLALMGLIAAKRKAQITRVQDDFEMITMALTQYKSDFRDYPRLADPSADIASTNGHWLDYASDRGARLLCQALIAPGPGTGANGITDGQDGADGPGFRIRRTAIGSTGDIGGKIYGPYLAADKFKLEFKPTVPNMADAKIMDSMGNVILYYPALPGPPMVGAAYVLNVDPSTYSPAGSPLPKPLYNAFDNTVDSTTGKSLVSLKDMRYMLGDTNMDGQIDVDSSFTPPRQEVAQTTLPYLLWTAGLDGNYGRDKNGKSDDIANFEFIGSVKK